MRLGDLVINKYDSESLVFQITGFSGDKAILKVLGLPLTTILPINSLLKIASVPRKKPPLKIISGGLNSSEP